MGWRVFGSICAAGVLWASQAGATTFTFSQTLEGHGAHAAQPDSVSYTQGPFITPAISPFQMHVGDTLNYSLGLVPGESITVQGSGSTVFLSFGFGEPAGFQDITATGTFTLYDGLGNVVMAQTRTITNDTLFGSIFWLQAGPVTFSRVGWVGTLDSLGFNAGLGFTPTSGVVFGPELHASGVSVSAPASSLGVPEPATWALVAIGVGAVGALLRYRRSRRLAPA